MCHFVGLEMTFKGGCSVTSKIGLADLRLVSGIPYPLVCFNTEKFQDFRNVIFLFDVC